ncbi:MAG TPA: radical SAM protein [Candidatus Omnitrophota bacterium]|nr:radical SAM protein [Candidatus Omnitrophota bacterium]
MKLLLLQPPVQDFYETDVRLQPIGLAYLKAAIAQHHPDVQVLVKNYHHGWGRKTIPLPREFSYLKKFYAKDDKSPFSTFHHYYHFGADFDAIAEDVAGEKPDIVGISILFAPYYREAVRCASAIKKKWHAPILAGGSFVSTMPKFILSHPDIDLIIQGEGERALVEFLTALKRGKGFREIPGLGFKKNTRLFLNPRKENFKIGELPFPDLSDLHEKHYLFEKKPMCFIVASRGCPYRCSFCSVHKTFGSRYRKRPSENILEEMKSRYRAGYRVFDFEDDNFALNREETISLCEKIAAAFPKRDIQLLAMNGICYWTLDRKLLKQMRQAGFTHLNLSLVSTNGTLLKAVHRPHFLKKYRSVVKDAARLGFRIVSYQILGLPGESLDSMIKTMICNAGLPVLLGASPFYLIPNSPIANDIEAETEEDIFKARLTSMAIETPQFDRSDIYTLFITTRILNFLKGIPVRSNKCSLQKALAVASRSAPRSMAGVEILKKLWHEKQFYAFTAKGPEPLPEFKTKLFFRVWDKLDKIVTLENKIITIRRSNNR